MATRTATFEQYHGSPAELYERYFVPAIGLPFARPVLDAASPRRGERVIDVACGTGVVARLAAERVGGDGRVCGIDGHAGMLDVARASTPPGIVEYREASADGLPYDDDSFDVALCSLSLQFFADKLGALAEMRRVLVPGGRVATATPGPTPPLFEELHDVLADELGTEVAAFVDAVFALHDPSRLHDLMTAARLTDVEATTRTLELDFDSPRDFLWQYMLSTPLAGAATALEPEPRARLEQAVAQRWERFATGDGGMHVEVGLLVGRGIATG